MKKIMFSIMALFAISTILTAGPEDAAKLLKIKALESKKAKYVSEVKELTADWKRPKPDVSVEELRTMKHTYDSLLLDLKSQILTIEMEINDIYKLTEKKSH